VVLPPGKSLAAELTLRFHTVRSTSAKRWPVDQGGENIRTGSHNVYEGYVRLWPFRLTPREEVQALTKQWGHIGRLIIGTARTNYVPFSAPEPGEVADCDQLDTENVTSLPSKR
jgi:hypothetical protein